MCIFRRYLPATTGLCERTGNRVLPGEAHDVAASLALALQADDFLDRRRAMLRPGKRSAAGAKKYADPAARAFGGYVPCAFRFLAANRC